MAGITTRATINFGAPSNALEWYIYAGGDSDEMTTANATMIDFHNKMVQKQNKELSRMFSQFNKDKKYAPGNDITYDSLVDNVDVWRDIINAEYERGVLYTGGRSLFYQAYGLNPAFVIVTEAALAEAKAAEAEAKAAEAESKAAEAEAKSAAEAEAADKVAEAAAKVTAAKTAEKNTTFLTDAIAADATKKRKNIIDQLKVFNDATASAKKVVDKTPLGNAMKFENKMALLGKLIDKLKDTGFVLVVTEFSKSKMSDLEGLCKQKGLQVPIGSGAESDYTVVISSHKINPTVLEIKSRTAPDFRVTIANETYFCVHFNSKLLDYAISETRTEEAIAADKAKYESYLDNDYIIGDFNGTPLMDEKQTKENKIVFDTDTQKQRGNFTGQSPKAISINPKPDSSHKQFIICNKVDTTIACKTYQFKPKLGAAKAVDDAQPPPEQAVDDAQPPPKQAHDIELTEINDSNPISNMPNKDDPFDHLIVISESTSESTKKGGKRKSKRKRNAKKTQRRRGKSRRNKYTR